MKLKNYFLSILFLCLMVASSFAQSDEIIYVYFDDESNVNSVTGRNADLDVIDSIRAAGIEVTEMNMPKISEAEIDQLSALDNAALVIIGRAIPSGNFESQEDRDGWNNVAAPVLSTNMWGLRSNRGKWFADSDGAAANIDNTMDMVLDAEIIEVGDPVFEGIDPVVGWWNGHYSILQLTEAGNGTVMASSLDDGYILFVRFEGLTPFYEGGETPYAERVFMSNGSDNLRDGDVKGYNYWGWTADSKKVFIREIERFLPSVSVNNIKNENHSLKVYSDLRLGEVIVSMDNLKSVNVYSLLGQKVKSIAVNKDVVSIPVTGSEKGIFVVEAFDAYGNRSVEKLLIK